MADIRVPRRHYLNKRYAALLYDDVEQANIWQAKQEAEPGTTLGGSFPLKSTLAPLGYTTIEDLQGADEAELMRAGLTKAQAAEVLAAL